MEKSQKNIPGNTCRVCLTEQEVLINLFDEVEDFHSVKLCDLLEACGEIKVQQEDNYPKLICWQCTNELFVTVTFLEKCKRTQAILAQFIPEEDTNDDDEVANEDVTSNNDTATIIVEDDQVEETTSPIIECDFKPFPLLSNDCTIDGSKAKFLDIKEDQYCNADENKTGPEICVVKAIGESLEAVEIEKEHSHPNDNTETLHMFDAIEYIDHVENVTPQNYILFEEDVEADHNGPTEVLNSEFEEQKECPVVTDATVKNCVETSLPSGENADGGFLQTVNNDSDIIEAAEDLIITTSDAQGINEVILEEEIQSSVTKLSKILTKPLVIHCVCDLCGAGFTHLNNLRRHLQTHNFEEIFFCPLCSYPFTKIENLQKHQENANSCKINSNVCQEYTVDFPELHVKMKKTHDNVNLDQKACQNVKVIKKNHKCQYCDKAFVSKSALAGHLRIHTGDRPFSCSECTKSFVTQGSLVLHMRRHTGQRPFQCNICMKRFVESSNLKVHMRIHTGEKPHKCTTCGRSFSRVFLLQLHQRTHTGERPYICPYCNKGFAQQGDLASHKRIHTGERPHRCPCCLKGFIKSSALTAHMRKHTKYQKDKSLTKHLNNVKTEDGNNFSTNFNAIILDDNNVENNIENSSFENIIVKEEIEI